MRAPERLYNLFELQSDRVRRHAFTVATNILARGLGLGIFIVSLHVAVPYLGAERYGIFAAVAGLASALTFMDLGVGNALVTRVAHLNANGDHDELRRLLGAAIALLSTIAIVVGAAGILFILVAPIQILFRGMAHSLIAETRNMLVVFVALLSISIPANAAARVFFGLQQGYIANSVCTAIGVLSLGAVALLPTFGFGMPMLLLATFGAEPISGVFLLSILWIRGDITLSSFDLMFQKIRSLLHTSRDFAILQIGGLAGSGADGLMASTLLGPLSVTQYSISQRIFMLISMPLHIINAPLWATYADADAAGDDRFIRNTLAASMVATAAIAAIGGMIVVISGPWVVDLLTHGTVRVPSLLLSNFAVWTTIEAMGMAFAMYMNGRGIVSPQVYVAIPYVVLSIILKCMLVPRVGISWIPAITSAVYILVVAVPFVTIFRSKILMKVGAPQLEGGLPG
jgi:O-antigen/teichoic acid export membrane protein